jgi:hypothetical protein
VPRRIFRYKMDEIKVGRKQLSDEELHDFSSPNIFRKVKSRRMMVTCRKNEGEEEWIESI